MSSAARTMQGAAASNARLDAAHIVAQDIWGRGNLSPLDILFGAQAVMSLVPAKGFGFSGLHMGSRLMKYAEDMKARVDAAEQDGLLTRIYAKKGGGIRSVCGKDGQSGFKPNRYECFLHFQSSVLGASPAVHYGEAAVALKKRGKLFAADLMESEMGAAAGGAMVRGLDGQAWRFHARETHVQSLEECGLEIESQHDMSAGLLASVRSGFHKSLAVLAELRAGEPEHRAKNLAAYWQQVETWGTVYSLVETGRLLAMGITAVKKR